MLIAVLLPFVKLTLVHVGDGVELVCTLVLWRDLKSITPLTRVSGSG